MGRLLCRIGLHAWKTVATGAWESDHYVTDECQRIRCGAFRSRYGKRLDRRPKNLG